MDTIFLHYPDNGYFIHRYPDTIEYLKKCTKFIKMGQQLATKMIGIQVSMDSWIPQNI